MKHQGVYIIAEAGVNHNGSLDIAKRLIDAAVTSGADGVKFQLFKAEELVSESAPIAEYQKNNTGNTDSQFEMLKRLELSDESVRILADYCNDRGIQFLATGFDTYSIDFIESIGVPFFKIPSGEITNLPYLRHISGKGKPVVLSTGMATLGEIEEALSILLEGSIQKTDITLLHCTTDYPALPCDVNLSAMQTISSAFPGVHVGYSDHTLGIEIAVAAVAMGARVIEKHFTLSKTMEGPDHRASLETKDLAYMVTAIRNVLKALGDGHKAPSRSELDNIFVVRKSIVAARPIEKGETLSDSNLSVKRPGGGISPMRWDEVVGRPASRDFYKDEMIVL